MLTNIHKRVKLSTSGQICSPVEHHGNSNLQRPKILQWPVEEFDLQSRPSKPQEPRTENHLGRAVSDFLIPSADCGKSH